MIDWKVRLKNPVFWVQIGASILMPILAYFKLTVEDLTTWQMVFDTLIDAVKNPYVFVTCAFSMWSTINNPTTKGLSDKEKK